MIARLEEARLISAGDVDRDDRYPERTTYHITPAGRAAVREWLAEMISTPRNEVPEFPAALSFLMMLTPVVAQGLLAERRELLARRLLELEAELVTEIEGRPAPRVALLDAEYARAVVDAELRWVAGVLAELRNGSFTWSHEELEPLATAALRDQG
jgi:DNA-binding PadR family transcriptional regulator